MRFTLVSALTLCLAALAPRSHAAPGQADGDAAFAPYAQPQQQVQVATGRSIHVMCMGQGSPTVILSAGANGWSADWRLVQPEIAKKTKVCGWDRAGHGFSSGSPEPQDIIHTEADLEQALAGAGLTGPFVMAAHSLGAFETLRFADRHPDRVAGMVLLDPSYPDQEEELYRVAPALMAYADRSDKPYFDAVRRCVTALKSGDRNPSPDCAKLVSYYPEPLRGNLLSATSGPLYWEAFLSMFQSLKPDAKLIMNAKRNYGSMPVVVLEAGVLAFPDAPADAQRDVPIARAAIKRGHEALVRLSTQGAALLVPDSAHMISIEKPAVVIDAIDKVVDEVRASGASPRR
jgi:pimeloyl-ACP methyl ester carboxylesterase